jgi:hypothetical protein
MVPSPRRKFERPVATWSEVACRAALSDLLLIANVKPAKAERWEMWRLKLRMIGGAVELTYAHKI